MPASLFAALALILLMPWLWSCGNSHAAATATPVPVPIRISTGVPTGTFGPFSEALVRGYRQLFPELRFELVEQSGSVGNLDALENGAVDLGLAQAGIAYMAYNGRLPDFGRSLRKIRGVAVLNSAIVQLVVGPGSRANSIEDVNTLRVGVGPAGTGNAVMSELLLSPAGSHAGRTRGVPVGQSADLLLARNLDAAFTISGTPHDEVRQATRGGARLVHVNGPAMDALRSAFPFLRLAVIPAGTYPNQRETIHTLAIDIVLLAREELDSAVVRRLTSGLFQMLPRLTSELDFLEGMDPQRAPATPIPLHRGATLYYRERELRR